MGKTNADEWGFGGVTIRGEQDFGDDVQDVRGVIHPDPGEIRIYVNRQLVWKGQP